MSSILDYDSSTPSAPGPAGGKGRWRRFLSDLADGYRGRGRWARPLRIVGVVVAAWLALDTLVALGLAVAYWTGSFHQPTRPVGAPATRPPVKSVIPTTVAPPSTTPSASVPSTVPASVPSTATPAATVSSPGAPAPTSSGSPPAESPTVAPSAAVTPTTQVFVQPQPSYSLSDQVSSVSGHADGSVTATISATATVDGGPDPGVDVTFSGACGSWQATTDGMGAASATLTCPKSALPATITVADSRNISTTASVT